jgi:hypothetical protein
MARRVYFAFHFERDIWRVNQVRNSNVVVGVEDAGFFDHSEYEKVKRQSQPEIARRIRERLYGTTVTIMLVGRQTWSRAWVQYEITESLANKNGFLAVYVHHLRDPNQPNDPGLPLPPVPLLPPGIECPRLMWDGNNVMAFRQAIEEAGRRADRARETDALSLARYYATILRKKT